MPDVQTNPYANHAIEMETEIANQKDHGNTNTERNVPKIAINQHVPQERNAAVNLNVLEFVTMIAKSL